MKALPSYKLLVSWRKIQFINLLFFAFLFADRLTLLQTLVNYQNQEQIRNLLVLRIPKLSLKVKFDLDL